MLNLFNQIHFNEILKDQPFCYYKGKKWTPISKQFGIKQVDIKAQISTVFQFFVS